MTDLADMIRQRFEALDPVLDEQARRRFAAAEALAVGHRHGEHRQTTTRDAPLPAA